LIKRSPVATTLLTIGLTLAGAFACTKLPVATMPQVDLPTIMVTASLILGALPLMFGFGEGSELRRPLGVAIVGGLVVSQLLTLYTTPVLYLVFNDIKRHVGRLRVNRHGVLTPSGIVNR